MRLKEGRVNICMGLSLGSEGKGNVSAYLAHKNPDLSLSLTCAGPNSGHFCRYGGEDVVLQQVPVSCLYTQSIGILTSGSVIDLDILKREIEAYNLMRRRIIISAYAPIINDKCREYEKEHLNYISSTFKGVGAAISLKAVRSRDIKLAMHESSLFEYTHFHISEIIHNKIGNNKGGALFELPQGYGLSINNELYPYVTSRPVNVGQALAYMDIPASYVGEVIGITRSYIIRVGNTPGGTSGNIYPDSKEITWEQLSDKLGKKVEEYTSVTKRKRRVFTFSKYLFERAVKNNGVTSLFFTFADYLTPKEIFHYKDYFTSSKFSFNNIYFVYGYWDFDKNIEKVK